MAGVGEAELFEEDHGAGIGGDGYGLDLAEDEGGERKEEEEEGGGGEEVVEAAFAHLVFVILSLR